jgi:hypothetical protein
MTSSAIKQSRLLRRDTHRSSSAARAEPALGAEGTPVTIRRAVLPEDLLPTPAGSSSGR